jgi:beta-barrel assembly-enhancing protease
MARQNERDRADAGRRPRPVARFGDVKLTVLDSEEINAFALPSGFLFINTGLIEKVVNAGVIAHELAHAAARHGARLMKRAMISSGGAVGFETYYALQYSFFGLDMALNLALLGVSHEY